MEKMYEFQVLAKMSEKYTGTSMYIIKAKNERDARNRFKMSFPDAHKIISCVRGREITKSQPPKTEISNSSGVGAIALGVAAVGGFVLSQLLGNKNKN